MMRELYRDLRYIKENDDVFNISFADYDQLNDYYKSVVLKAMVGNNFKSADRSENKV